jgi:hypothetical protein
MWVWETHGYLFTHTGMGMGMIWVWGRVWMLVYLLGTGLGRQNLWILYPLTSLEGKNKRGCVIQWLVVTARKHRRFFCSQRPNCRAAP